MRASKTVNRQKHRYWYQDGRLIYEERDDGRQFCYSYDGYGNLSCIRYYYNGESYAYYVQTNSRGDVEALYGGDGIIRVRYIYDSWGNTLSVQDANGQEITSPNNMGNLNPFRYRGYYFDTETGLYYLHSRYYDPETCRFVNGDGYVSTGQGFTGNNMFAYCLNSPVQFIDQTGTLVALANSGGCYNSSLNAGSQIVKTMNDCSPAYAVCAGVSLLDGPLPVGDTVGLAGAAIITIGAAIYGVHQASLAIKAQEQEKDIAVPSQSKRKAYFTVDPYQFNPRGLVRTTYVAPGTGKNGGIIKWEIPVSHS